jgi:hypothetical protein
MAANRLSSARPPQIAQTMPRVPAVSELRFTIWLVVDAVMSVMIDYLSCSHLMYGNELMNFKKLTRTSTGILAT